jgi:hypothetical protein
MLVKEDLAQPAQRGASARLVPPPQDGKNRIMDMSMLFSLENVEKILFDTGITPVIGDIIAPLTTPLTEEEKPMLQ